MDGQVSLHQASKASVRGYVGAAAAYVRQRCSALDHSSSTTTHNWHVNICLRRKPDVPKVVTGFLADINAKGAPSIVECLRSDNLTDFASPEIVEGLNQAHSTIEVLIARCRYFVF